MKVGILTFHKQLNCGASLQAYAIKRAYEKCGADVQVIDFFTQQMTDRCKIFLKGGLKARLVNVLLLFQYPHYLRTRKGFMDFAQKYMNLTKHYSTYEELTGLEEQFDVISTGSDQVFNCNKIPFDQIRGYCQDFHSSARKVAYAGSMGDGVAEYIDKLTALRDFEYISLREDYNKETLEKMTGKEVDVVCDPTYLHDRQEYEKIAKDRMYKKPYILCYCLTNPKKLYDMAKEVKRLTGLDVVVIARQPGVKIRADKVYKNVEPREFLSLVQHAEYVVTNSFHGVAFSTIFEKPFFVYASSKTKKARIKERLAKFELADRIVYDDSPEITREQLSVDFTYAKKVVEQDRAHCMEFIKKAIGE